jgi:hypothetical protein
MSATDELTKFMDGPCVVCGKPPRYCSDIGALCPECFTDSKQIERTLMMKVGLRPMTALEFARYQERRAA